MGCRRSTLFVAGFSAGTRAKDLALEFESYGRIVRCDIPAPRSSAVRPRYAFVEFEDIEDAREAFYGMQGCMLFGGSLNVQWARNEPSRNWRYDDHRDRSYSRTPPRRSRSRSYSRSPPHRSSCRSISPPSRSPPRRSRYRSPSRSPRKSRYRSSPRSPANYRRYSRSPPPKYYRRGRSRSRSVSPQSPRSRSPEEDVRRRRSPFQSDHRDEAQADPSPHEKNAHGSPTSDKSSPRSHSSQSKPCEEGDYQDNHSNSHSNAGSKSPRPATSGRTPADGSPESNSSHSGAEPRDQESPAQ